MSSVVERRAAERGDAEGARAVVPILSARPGGWHIDELRRALRERGYEGRVVAYETLVARLGATARRATASLSAVGDTELLTAGVALARIIPNGSLEQIIYRVDALHWLEDSGVAVVNAPRAIERCVDKFYTSALLQRADLATPDTVVCERAEDATTAFRELGDDVIVKPLFGSMGLGMLRVADPETAFRVFRALEAIHAVYYLQRAIDHGGRDVRVFVVGDRVVGAIERSAPGWRTNVSRGAAARAIALPDEWVELALRAVRAVGADYAGVDLIPDGDGATVYVIEVNAIPGWQGLQEATGVDVAGAIVDHALARAAAPAALG